MDAAEFNRQVESFRLLYEIVTARLNRVVAACSQPEEKRWLESVIRGFRERFDAWPNDPALQVYLEEVARKSGGSKLLFLIGHAYLHVAHDLPVVLANSLIQPRWSDAAFWARAKHAYTGLEKEFGHALREAASNPKIVGWFWASIAKIGTSLFPDLSDEGVHGLTQWLIVLRKEAWENAETLVMISKSDKELIRQQIVASMERSLNSIPHRARGAGWVNRLGNPLHGWNLFLGPLQELKRPRRERPYDPERPETN